jgi:hypothetical protein
MGIVRQNVLQEPVFIRGSVLILNILILNILILKILIFLNFYKH